MMRIRTETVMPIKLRELRLSLYAVQVAALFIQIVPPALVKFGLLTHTLSTWILYVVVWGCCSLIHYVCMVLLQALRHTYTITGTF